MIEMSYDKNAQRKKVQNRDSFGISDIQWWCSLELRSSASKGKITKGWPGFKTRITKKKIIIRIPKIIKIEIRHDI